MSKLLGSPARTKLLRLFAFNPERVFDRDMVVRVSRITPDTASRELAALARAEVIKRKTYYKDVVRPGSKTAKKRKTIGWILNQNYLFIDALTRFLRDTLSISSVDVRKRLRGAGSIKLLVLSGILVGEKSGGVDMLIVGDRLNEQHVYNAVCALEAECGQEIRYSVMTTEEYRYRRRVRDKLVRDIMDFPHHEVIDRLVNA